MWPAREGEVLQARIAPTERGICCRSEGLGELPDASPVTGEAMALGLRRCEADRVTSER